MSSEEQTNQPPPQQEGDQATEPPPAVPVTEQADPAAPAPPPNTPAPETVAPAPTADAAPVEEVSLDTAFSAPVPAPEAVALAPEATAAAPAMATASAHDDDAAPQALHHHLYRAKALSERLLAVMAQREERLAEIKRRVGLLEPGGDSVQPLIEAENNMRDAHTRMKAVLNDLGTELQVAGVTALPPQETKLADIPEHAGQGDEVAFLYKNLLLALGEWKSAQKKLATDRAESLGKQVQALREQVAREHAETQRIRQRKEQLEQLRHEKQDELDAFKKDQPDHEHKE